MTRHRLRAVSVTCLLALCSLVESGCAAPRTNPEDDASPLRVYATTGYLADAVHQLAPTADITTMVGPGGDPHTYQASTKDIERILAADLVVWNGLGLEAQLRDPLRSLGDKQIAVGDTLPESMRIVASPDAGDELRYDPHIWNDPEAWKLVVGAIADALATLDPLHAPEYAQRALAYQNEITRVDTELTTLLSAIPHPRTLLTGHDAFGYFGRHYGLTVLATDFISTEATLSANELSGLATTIVTKGIPTVFLDSQANPQAITSLSEAVLARGGTVELSPSVLYADTLGTEPGTTSYLGVLRHNAQAIAEGLTAHTRTETP